MLGQVEAIITDSPIITGLMYYKEPNQKIRKLEVPLKTIF